MFHYFDSFSTSYYCFDSDDELTMANELKAASKGGFLVDGSGQDMLLLKDFEVLAEEYLNYCIEVKQRLQRRGVAVSIHSLVKSLCPPLMDASLPPVQESRRQPDWQGSSSDAGEATRGNKLADARITAAKMMQHKRHQLST